MKFWMTVAALFCMMLPAEAAKKVRTPKSRNAAAYRTHKASKVKGHKMTKAQKRKFKNRVN